MSQEVFKEASVEQLVNDSTKAVEMPFDHPNEQSEKYYYQGRDLLQRFFLIQKR